MRLLTLTLFGLAICLFTLFTEYVCGGQSCSFEASANWFKGMGLEPSQLAKTDPSQTTKELSMTYGENVTAHVAYRCPAINKDQEAKVSYKLFIERPDKAGDSENQKGITAGAGKILPDQLKFWAASHNRVTVRFTRQGDPPGTYWFNVWVKDHIGNQKVLCRTKVALK